MVNNYSTLTDLGTPPILTLKTIARLLSKEENYQKLKFSHLIIFYKDIKFVRSFAIHMGSLPFIHCTS